MLFEFGLFSPVGLEAVKCTGLMAKAFVSREKELGIWYDHKWKSNGTQFAHLGLLHLQLRTQKAVFSCFGKFHSERQTFIRLA